MPNLGIYHPQVIHFAIALALLGVGLRVLSLFRINSWLNPAARTLLLLGTVAIVISVKSGVDAHGPVERIPGARNAVVEHEEWGERTRNIFFGIVALELLALALGDRKKPVLIASAVVGLAGAFAMYETGEHGGELVYSYAGGPGIRSGDPGDVNRLMLAGLYSQAMLDRREKRPEQAAALFDVLASRFPQDRAIQQLAAESKWRDLNDIAGARAALDAIPVPTDDERVARGLKILKVDLLAAAGVRDSARMLLEEIMKGIPANPRLQAKLDSLK